MKKILFLSATAIICLIACKKNDPAPVSFLEEIDGNQYKKTSIYTSNDSITDTIPVNDFFASLSDCKKDNVWSFNKTTLTFTLDEGASKCNAADPQTKDEGTIAEQDSGNSLKVDGGGTNEIWNIESRSASSFRVSYFARNSSNQLVKFRVVFTKL